MDKIWVSKNYESSNLFEFESFISKKYNLNFSNYGELHQWSITNLENFWESIAEFYKIEFDQKYDFVLKKNIPFYKTEWFKNAELSYSNHILRHAKKGETAIIYKNESDTIIEISWNSLLEKVKKIRESLIGFGVSKGDVVAGYLLNHPDTIASFIAVNSLGAIWSCCSPDFGVESIVNRFNQLDPKVLLAHKSYLYNGKLYEQKDKINDLEKKLPSVKNTILFDSSFNSWNFQSNYWIDFELKSVKFNDPIWVLFSSGTTGKPKAITHGTGGILLEQYKSHSLHQNIIKGDMNFIGPRPVILSEKKLLKLRHSYGIDSQKPGITGYAQINGRDLVSIERKVVLERYYLYNKNNVWLNFRILLRTIIIVLRSTGVRF